MDNFKSFVAWMWTLHLLWALWLSTGVFSSAVVFAQVKRAGDLAGRVFGLRLAWRLMTVFIIPGALITGGLGFYLIYGFRFGFVFGWVKVSVVLYAILLATILLYQTPYLRRALRAGEEALRGNGETAASAELERLARAPLPAMLTHINALLILIMIILMAMKPVPS